MVANTLLIERGDDPGRRLFEALDSSPVSIQIAFWGKPTDADKWYLYLASPFVDEKGSMDAYGHVNRELRRMPDLGIEPLDVKVLGMNDSLTEAVHAKLEPRIPNSPFAVTAPKPYPGMTVLYGCTLGGYEFDEVLIYPPRPSQVTP